VALEWLRAAEDEGRRSISPETEKVNRPVFRCQHIEGARGEEYSGLSTSNSYL
jgi:hypothetical protein